MFQLLTRVSAKLVKVNPQDFLTQDTVKFLIDVVKEALKP